MESLLSWLSINWIEFAAALVSITYVILSIKQIIWLWFFGILSAIMYAWVYRNSGFYAGMALQVYYGVISVYGWYHWSVRTGRNDKTAGLPVIRLHRPLLIMLIGVWLVIWLVIGEILHQLTDSEIPFWDSFTASGGVVATWMLARKILEHWIFWIIIDLVSIGLYVWQELYITSLLFFLYVIMAMAGYSQWRKAWLQTL